MKNKPIPHYAITRCTCGKWIYAGRKAARRAARALHQGEHMSAYECRLQPGAWHIGHLPPLVVRGRADRANLNTRLERGDHP